jgi:hypothetical protein
LQAINRRKEATEELARIWLKKMGLGGFVILWKAGVALGGFKRLNSPAFACAKSLSP